MPAVYSTQSSPLAFTALGQIAFRPLGLELLNWPRFSPQHIADLFEPGAQGIAEQRRGRQTFGCGPILIVAVQASASKRLL